MKVGFRILWVLVGSLAFATLISPIAFYFYGLSFVPEDRNPQFAPEIPDATVSAYWRFLGGEGDVRVAKRNPYTFLLDMYRTINDHESGSDPDAEVQLVGQAARTIMFRHPRDSMPRGWHPGNMSAAIWVSRRWSAGDAIRTVLSDDFYGNGFFGIDEASAGYFGKPLAELSDTELFHLFVTRRAPSMLNLWCDPEKNMEISGPVLDRAGVPQLDISSHITPVPEGECGA